MEYWTYSQIKQKLHYDLALEQEIFVRPDELLGYVNAGIDEAEAEIHTIYEDYFLSMTEISLVAGTDLYELPSDIYANKIRGVIYKRSSTDYYPIKRIKEMHKFLNFEESQFTNVTSDYYRYMILNSSAAAGPRLYLSPTPSEDLTNAIRIWYIRNANKLAADTDVCDIPEFVDFVLQYAKVRVYEKERDTASIQLASAVLERKRQLMKDTLTQMVPDSDNEVEQDRTFYEDMV